MRKLIGLISFERLQRRFCILGLFLGGKKLFWSKSSFSKYRYGSFHPAKEPEFIDTKVVGTISRLMSFIWVELDVLD